jgi:hypothetical protein
MNSPIAQMRRYDLPTCLLEVWAERSPLSEWSDRPVAQNLRFHLRLDQQAQPKVIKGNQSQISKLIETVLLYVDRMLASDRLPELNHTLNVPNFQQIKLTTLQLFDLFTSLEQCADEIVILPSLELEVKRITPAWLKIAAAAIASVGVTVGTIRLVMPQSPVLQVATSASPETSSETKSLPKSEPGSAKPRAADQDANKKIPSPDPNGNVAKSPTQTNPSVISPSVQASSAPTLQPPTDRSSDERFRRTAPDQVAVAPPLAPVPSNGTSGNLPRSTPAPLTRPLEPSLPETKPSETNLEPKLETRAQSEAIKPSNPARLPSPSNTDLAATRKVDGAISGSAATTPGAGLQYYQRAIAVINLESIDDKSGLRRSIPSNYATSLSQYLQTLRLSQPLQGIVEIELVVRDRRVESVVINGQDSGFLASKDSDVDLLKRSLLNWTPPQALQEVPADTPVKLHLILQIQ